MQAWVDLVAAATGERRLWDRGFQFGDWLDPNAPPDKPADARTAPSIVATAYFARSAELLGQAAQVLERTDDAQRYGVLANEVRTAFAQEYITPNGRMVSDATTAYALAIAFALLPTAEQRRAAGARLAALVRDNRYRISTGFVGTPLICDALCSVGENTTAFRLLTERDNPSWLYPVTMGATTIWERWDSMLPDGGINPGEMTSFNHYALGAVADWLHRTVGGLTPAAPGYRHLRIKPCPGGLTYARARHRTPYGLAECAWKIESEEVTVALVVPPNTTACVTLPGANGQSIEAGTHRWSVPYQNAGVVRPSLSLDSTLAEIIDDREAWATVRATIAQHLPELVQQIDAGDGIGGNTSLTLRQLLAMRLHTNGSQANLEAVLVDPSH